MPCRSCSKKRHLFFSQKIPRLGVESFKIVHDLYFFHTFPPTSSVRQSNLQLDTFGVVRWRHQKIRWIQPIILSPVLRWCFKLNNPRKERLLMICRLPWNIVDLLTAISWPLITLWWTNIASLNPPILKRRYTLKKVRFSLPRSFLPESIHCYLESDDVRCEFIYETTAASTKYGCFQK